MYRVNVVFSKPRPIRLPDLNSNELAYAQLSEKVHDNYLDKYLLIIVMCVC